MNKLKTDLNMKVYQTWDKQAHTFWQKLAGQNYQLRPITPKEDLYQNWVGKSQIFWEELAQLHTYQLPQTIKMKAKK
ncbi:MAG: hypothetical protein QNJ54_19720 [Prochloraceae cyanobacterium]|nr:hypothetical protein [Prochloraceae cyanobacterium]